MKSWLISSLIYSLIIFCLPAFSKSIDQEIFDKHLNEIFKTDYSVSDTKNITTKKEVIKQSAGSKKIAELLALNKQKIKNIQGEIKKIKMEKESITNDNKKDSFFEKYKKEEDAKYEKWSKDYDSLVNKWDQDHKKYLTRVESYKLHTEKVESDKEILKRLKKEYKYETIKVSVLSESKIVDSAMDFDVKDQALRPTCSAFAAIRGIEIKLKQQNKLFDLSEQYFYWASKPNCQKKKCSQKGSWAGYGLEHSKESKRKDIPLLKDCPYKDQTNYKNETQIPLENSCKSGVAKVGAFSYIKNLDEVLKSIDNNNPVIAGITLDSRFYFNKGYIGLKNKLESSFKDSHANGHAVLFIGYKKLPEELHKEEGKVCFIAANSWGIGWGRAGHACISEKWLLKNKRDTPFMSIDKVI